MDFREKRHDFTLNISEQVIAQIAQLVVSDVEGVAQVVEPPKSFRRWLLPKTTHQLVQITPLSDSVEISIFVLLAQRLPHQRGGGAGAKLRQAGGAGSDR